MLKQYKKVLILTSLATLLPIPVQLLLGREWGMTMTLPLMLLGTQWFCIFWTLHDRENKKQSRKPMLVVLWTIPVISNFCAAMDYALASGWKFSISAVFSLVFGLMFAAIGNYLPKVKMNSTMGIKIPWAYSSEENWNATHRFGGKCWFWGGIGIAASALLPENHAVTVLFVGIWVMVLLPMFYSYRYYKTQKARGDVLRPLPTIANGKAGKISLVFLIIILVFVGSLLFTGDIEYHFDTDRLVIEADFYDDLVLVYDVLESIEYRDSNVSGSRAWGYGSFRLLLGTFQNEEFGTYTRYTYYDPKNTVILKTMKQTYVLSGETPEQTREIYDTLLEMMD